MKRIAIPITIIVVGIGWLLTVHGVLPGVNWLWVLALGLAGVLVPALLGIDKATMVIGPFLILSTIMSLLRQTDRISIDTEVPLLVIGLGVLLLVVQLTPLPHPKWLYDPIRANGES